MTKSRNIRKPHVPRDRLMPLEELSAKLVELLTIAPRTRVELEALTGWSTFTLRPRLEQLYENGTIGVTGIPGKKQGIQKLWYVGAEPDYALVDDTAARDCLTPPGYSEMKQITVQQYEIHSFRHPQDIALFGPARREAA